MDHYGDKVADEAGMVAHGDGHKGMFGHERKLKHHSKGENHKEHHYKDTYKDNYKDTYKDHYKDNYKDNYKDHYAEEEVDNEPSSDHEAGTICSDRHLNPERM